MIYELIYLLLCGVMAYANYRAIRANKRIYHGVNGIFHIQYWVVVYLLTHNWVLIAIFPFIARLFFDLALNMMRGLPINYVSKSPKSIADKIEKKIFGLDGLTPKAIYLVIIIALNFFL